MEVEEPEPSQQDSGTRRSKVCAVCGGESQTYHLNFGVGTCNSCRAFFRRSVQVRLLLIEGRGRPILSWSIQSVHCFRAATLSSTQQGICWVPNAKVLGIALLHSARGSDAAGVAFPLASPPEWTPNGCSRRSRRGKSAGHGSVLKNETMVHECIDLPQVALQEGHPEEAEGDRVTHRGEEGSHRIRHSVFWETKAAAGAARGTARIRGRRYRRYNGGPEGRAETRDCHQGSGQPDRLHHK